MTCRVRESLPDPVRNRFHAPSAVKRSALLTTRHSSWLPRPLAGRGEHAWPPTGPAASRSGSFESVRPASQGLACPSRPGWIRRRSSPNRHMANTHPAQGPECPQPVRGHRQCMAGKGNVLNCKQNFGRMRWHRICCVSGDGRKWRQKVSTRAGHVFRGTVARECVIWNSKG